MREHKLLFKKNKSVHALSHKTVPGNIYTEQTDKTIYFLK